MMKSQEVVDWIADEIIDLATDLPILQQADKICAEEGLTSYLVDITAVVKKQENDTDGYVRFVVHIDDNAVILEATHDFFFSDGDELGIITTEAKDKPIIPHLSASAQAKVHLYDVIDLDESITSMKNRLEGMKDSKSKEVFIQIIDWLEELKEYRKLIGYIKKVF